MSTKILYATLTDDGWTNEPLKVIDQVLKNFFTSLASQSNMFDKQVESFALYMQKNKGDPQSLAMDTQSALRNLFTPYFDNVEIRIEVVESDTSKKSVKVMGTMDDATGESYDIGRAFVMDGLSVLNVLKIHNG